MGEGKIKRKKVGVAGRANLGERTLMVRRKEIPCGATKRNCQDWVRDIDFQCPRNYGAYWSSE